MVLFKNLTDLFINYYHEYIRVWCHGYAFQNKELNSQIHTKKYLD